MGITYNQNNVTGRRLAKETQYPITIGDGVNSWGRFNATQGLVNYEIFAKHNIGASIAIEAMSMATDVNGFQHVVYIDNSGGANDQDVMYSTNMSGSWSAATVVYAAADNNSVAIAIGTENGGANPWLHVAIGQGGGAADKVVHAYKLVASGAWATENIYAAATTAPDSVSISIDSTNLVHVSWNQLTTASYGIRYAVRSTAFTNVFVAGTWSGGTPVVIDIHTDAVLYRRSQVVIDNSDTAYIVSEYYGNGGAATSGIYLFDTASSLVATLKNAAATASFAGSNGAVIQGGILHYTWYHTTNATVSYSYASVGVWTSTDASLRNCTNGSVPNPTIAIGSSYVHIAHWDQLQGSGGTAVAGLWYSTNRSGSFVTKLVDPSAYGGGISTKIRAAINTSIIDETISILSYDDTTNVTTAPQINMLQALPTNTNTQVREYDLYPALTAAAASLPEVGGKIEILAGTYILSADVSLLDNVELVGQGSASTIIKIDPYVGKLYIGDGVTSSVGGGGMVHKIQFVSLNPLPYEYESQLSETMLTLTIMPYSQNVTVQNCMFTGYGIGNILDKDMEWTIADGHIVDSNISTTGVTGLGGI